MFDSSHQNPTSSRSTARSGGTPSAAQTASVPSAPPAERAAPTGPVDSQAAAPLLSHFADGAARGAGETPLSPSWSQGAVQAKEGSPWDFEAPFREPASVQRTAAQGVSGPGGPLPFQEQISRSFGPRHDVSGIQAHVGGPATTAAHSIGAEAYATGNRVAFSRQPDLHTAAHEAAHVVQQRGGVQLRGGVGQRGDAYEQHADAVADRVVQGKSAADLLDGRGAGSGALAQGDAVQMTGWWETMRRGAGIYLGLTLKDEGSAYAKALMRHYVIGGGGEFNPTSMSVNFPTDAMWSSFMAGRPEIQRAMERLFQTQAQSVAAGGAPSGHISTRITDVRLNELESMRWTLHGCHRIEVETDYAVTDDGGGNKTVTFSDMHFRWIDVGDMHPGTTTETDSGEQIDDAQLTGAGRSFPINIPFAAPGSSVWQVTGGAATHQSGWPQAASATSRRNRG